MPYIGVSPQFGVRRKHTYTATAGQTSFSGAGSEGATLSYTDSNFVDVYQNGVKLGDADYTSTSGTAIVLAQGASVDDLVEIIVFDAFSAADTVSKADGGTFDGAVTFGSAVTADAGVSVDNITIDGTEIDLSSGDLTLDAAGNIILDADGGVVRVYDGGTQIGNFANNSSEFHVNVSVQDKDFVINGNDGGSTIEAMRIDMSEGGKVGIGTNSPDSLLSVCLTDGTGTYFEGGGTASSANARRLLITASTTTNAGDTHTLNAESSTGHLALATANTERAKINGTGYFHVSQDISDSTFYNATYTNSFSHSNTQNVLFLENSGDGNVYGLVIDFTDAVPDNHTSYFMQCQDNSVIRFKIWSDGDVINHDNSYGSTSDIKLKEQIKDASSQWEDVKALKIRKYKMKEDVAKGDSDAHWRLGVIAQELETAGMNGLVKDDADLETNSDGKIVETGTTTKVVKYSILYMKAVKALQEAMTRIEALETENKTQATQIADLISRVTALESK